MLDVSKYSELSIRLNACFESQIQGGKNYGDAVIGRRKANATFSSTHTVDECEMVWLAMDVTCLGHDSSIDVREYVFD